MDYHLLYSSHHFSMWHGTNQETILVLEWQQEVIQNDKQSTRKSGLKEVEEKVRGEIDKKDSRERN